MKVRLFAAGALAALIGLTAPRSGPAADTSSIYETLKLMQNHTVLFVATTEAKEAETLKGDGPHTLFAPTDAAFKRLDDATIKKIATDKDTVKQLLRSHLVSGKRMAADLKKLDGMDLRTLRGNALKVEDAKDGLRVGGAKLVDADIRCSNGVIHVIDTVLPVTK
ncbi:fasciclin domain-containing protein [Frigoriglobus tundricola]|uniref:FAS1 domain-containing protein n=1 Tax=Frigoriglobus tundricola TaxID=2774151 RepID=A0A6M5YTS0_9BACT|nr:fasciclin domain-containing protein [Frigoriglobus tundricola]QJW97428.1 hypothetical protein FTUN_5002 [Frigoriglobus tundricola]